MIKIIGAFILFRVSIICYIWKVELPENMDGQKNILLLRLKKNESENWNDLQELINDTVVF